MQRRHFSTGAEVVPRIADTPEPRQGALPRWRSIKPRTFMCCAVACVMLAACQWLPWS
jgi:hypothetical protein